MHRCLRWPGGSICPQTSWSLFPSGLSLNDVLFSVSCHNKVPHTRWLKHTYFSQFQGWKSKIRFLLRAQFLACRWPPSHCVPHGETESERETGRALSDVSSPGTLILWDQGPTLKISIKSLSPDTVTSGVGASTYEFESIQFKPVREEKTVVPKVSQTLLLVTN